MRDPADTTAHLPTLRQFLANVGSSWTYKATSMVASVLITALAVREYGFEGMALIILATQVGFYAQLLEFGVPSSLSRRLPNFLVAMDLNSARILCSSALAMLLVSSASLIILVPFFAMVVPRILFIPTDAQAIAGLLFGLTVGAVAVQLPFRIGYGLLLSTHRIYWYFNFETWAVLAKLLLLTSLLALFDLPIFVYVAATLLPAILAAIAEFRIGLRAVSVWRFSIKQVSGASLIELLSLSWATMLGTFATALTVQGATLAIAIIDGPSGAVEFGLPMILASSLIAFASGGAGLLSPIASQLRNRDDRRLRETILLATRYSVALGLLIGLGTWLLGPTILSLWLGEENLGNGKLDRMGLVLLIAVIGGTIAIPAANARGALVAIGRHWTVAHVQLATGLAGLSFALVLGLTFQDAPVVFAISFATTGLITSVLLCRILNLELGITFMPYLFMAVRLAMPLGGGAVVILLFGHMDPNHGVFITIPRSLLAILAFLVGTFVFVLELRHRTAIIQAIRVLVGYPNRLVRR